MRQGTKKCPKCGDFYRSQGYKKHVENCKGVKRTKSNGKKRKRCPHCDKMFITKSGGWWRHVQACRENPALRAKGPSTKKTVAKKKAPKAPKAPQERFAVFGPTRDLESYAIVGSLKDAQMLAAELLEQGTEPYDIAVLRVVGEYQVERVEAANLTLKK